MPEINKMERVNFLNKNKSKIITVLVDKKKSIVALKILELSLRLSHIF